MAPRVWLGHIVVIRVPALLNRSRFTVSSLVDLLIFAFDWPSRIAVYNSISDKLFALNNWHLHRYNYEQRIHGERERLITHI
jgi:hypothetical protein